MKTFKQFVSESIYASGNKLIITKQVDRAASTHDTISTRFRKLPYVSNVKGMGAPVYSLLNYVPSDETTNLLLSLKGKGTLELNATQKDTFMKEVSIASRKVIQDFKPDAIIYPKSSSPFTSEFADAVIQQANGVKVLKDGFAKAMLDAENVEPLLNTSHPDWPKFAKDNPKLVDKLKKSLASQIKSNAGYLNAKDLYKQQARFIKNFLELKVAYEKLDDVIGKRVLVIDDVFSTGTSMSDMIRQVNEFEPSAVAGFTLFKRTSMKKQT